MNKRTEQTRWTPKRLLSLLMAFIMTLSLLPTAALAAAGDYKVTITDNPTGLFVGQTSGDITATLTAKSSPEEKTVRLKITVHPTGASESIATAGTIQYWDTSSSTYKDVLTTADTTAGTITGYLDAGPSTLSSGGNVSATFRLKFDKSGYCGYTVEAFEWDTTAGSEGASLAAKHSMGFNVKDAIESLSVTPTNPEAGQQFTVTAMTNVNNGHVAFTYNGVTKSAPVSPLPNNEGYAEYTFTAETDKTVVTANLFDAAGIPPADKSVTFTVGAPAANYTVVFRANGDNVYTLPAPQTVKHGEKAVTPVTPERKGYTFEGWYTDAACTNAAAYTFADPVTKNLELYAKWTATPVTIEITKDTDDVTVFPPPSAGSTTTLPGAIGKTANFNVTVPAKYDTANMIVQAGPHDGEHQYLVPELQSTDATGSVTFHYQLLVTEDIVVDEGGVLKVPVHVGPVTEKTFTVMMPTGHFNAEITGATPVPTTTTAGSTVAAGGKSASIVYGGDYTFTVTPDEGYAVAVYVNSVKQTAGADGKYTVKNVTGPQSVVVVESAIPNYNVTFTVPQSGEFFTQSVMSGGKATKPTVNPIREGYKFDGWYTADQYPDGTPFNFDTLINEDTVLYGKLTPNTYTITYDLNGASGTAPTAQTKKHGQAVPLSTEVPTREGFTFLGWGTTAKATAASYQPGDMYSVDGTITLYAVWKENTYTVTLPTGQGYSISTEQSTTVTHGGNFEFTVTVAREYAQKDPTVTVNGGGTLSTPTRTPNGDQSVSYTYTISGIMADQIVSVSVSQNLMFTVTFEAPAGTFYREQQVEQGSIATRPADPEVDGFTFGGWYKDTGWTDANKWDFATDKVTEPTTLYAKLDPITPQITWPTTTTGYTMKVEYTKPGGTTATELTTNPGTVPYKSVVTFTIKIDEGYDASKMLVGLNGVLFSPKDITGDTYTYEFIAKADTKITVTGIERKTVTVIYNANARDDVSGMPEAQTVKYYLDTPTAVNDTIIKQFPVRTGYKFLGWSKDSKADAADSDYTVEKIEAGTTAKFTENTTLYAVWEAQSTNVTLAITDVAYAPSAGRVIQYEGESITLQATLNHFAVGSVTFYKSSTKEANKTNSTIVGSTSIEGTTATFRTTVGEYKTTAKDEYYWAEFTPNADDGYSGSTSGVMNVGIFSKALSWKITKGTSNVADNGNVLNVYEGDSATGTPITGNMVAGRTYTLEVKTASITGVETLDSKQPVLGKDYKIVWQYTEVGKNDWKTDGEASDKATYLVTGDKSGYQFRAQIVPLGPDNGSLFVKAGKFENDALVNNQYDTCLYTKSTDTTVRQATATALTIDAPEESKDIKINGAKPFTAIGDHKAQFEGQAVTLTATVTDTTTGTPAVTTGFVDFYRKGATAATKLNASPIAVGANGVATYEVEISKWTGGNVTDNKDEFYAVYLANATYDTSNSKTTLQAVYIKSTAIKTPIIDSTLPGKLNGADANSTSYEHDLTGLLAGVQHTFKLRQDADQTAKDYSVVALDGRTVDATNYDIKWLKTTGSNEQEVDATGTNQIKVDENKVDDRYRVKLTGKGVFAGSEATSKDAVIGTKQDVTVTVKAIDAITKTPETDVYQLNEITLTATVAAANDKPTMQPTGTVTFYYKDGDSWVKLDSATLAEDTNHSMTASITTKKLPVTDTTNTWRNVEITAVYEGNDTFNVSRNYDATNSTVSAGTTENGVKDDTVTVYSSVVFNCNDENKKQPTDGDKGIHISVSDGAFKTNETATLALSDIYTLDRELTDETLRNTIAKLNPTTDYTVQWQKLNGATAITSGDYSAAKNWTNIDGKTGTTLVLDKVEQNTAYRAVITVNDQPITKGSYKEVDQTIKGRQVYYSNVLMPTDTNMTVSVALNTSKIGAENTEGITEGETVTANVFLSGVVGVVPNANVTVTVTNDSAKGNDTAYEKTFTSMNTVNGWNAFSWNTAESDDNGVPTAPGFYTLTVSATTNTGYAAKEITRSLIVRESSYNIEVGNTNPTYNGHTQGLTVTLDGFDFNGTGINEAANKSWTVKYYDKDNNLVEPTQAGTYRAVITLPASAYWTEQTKTVDFTIEKRSVSIADAIAQAKVYDGTTDVSIVEVMLNDAVTDQTTNGTGLPTNNVGIINGDSIYAVATAASLNSANAGNNSFTISTIELRGDDANNYVWDKKPYTENIYVSRSQVYGVSSTDVTLKAGEKLPADAVYMIDQVGNKITTYDVLYYLHTDTEIKKVDNTNEKGLYTVIVRPKQDNYKSGVTLKVTVGDTTSYTPAVAPKPSTLLYLSDTATKYNPAGNAPVTAKNAQGNAVKVEYQTGTTWSETVPSYAGRYLVKATDAISGDVAYGIYTITKAHPSISITAAEATYNSMPYTGATPDLTKATENPEHYLTYAGDVAIGYNTPADGNVDEQAPVDAGTYTVTLHVNETENYTAHEISKSFTIAKKALTIKADSWQTTQYDAFPDMTAGYTGLAAETGDTTPDTSLRDVQIAPEFLYNPTGGKSNYSNDSLDQVGGVAIQPIDALSKNYAITYEKGQYTKQRTETNVDLDIHGLPQSSTGKNTVYYGDEIQLYPYGYYTTHANGSGIFNWSVSAGAPATIDADKGILKVTGVGEFTVTLKRGVGEQQIETKLTVTALKKEVKVHVADQNKVYSGSAQTYSGEVKAYDELYATVNAATTTPANNTRTDIGTQITTSRIATGSEKYQSLVYGGKFTINDKDATVAPVVDAHIYGTTRTIPSPAYTSTDSNAISNVLTASQTDAYNRLDVHDGYEILVAGAENMNYNVKYTTDETAEDSAVTTYGGMKLYSTTTKAKELMTAELNDATVYGEQANGLDWILDAVKSTTRDSVDYADNLADFDLTDTTGIFIKQDKDDCVGNAKTYKAANRVAGNTSNTALAADRTATEKAADDNYELVFGSVTNAKAANYTLANAEVKNAEGTMTAPTGTVGFIGATTTSDNLIEGSANIAQRPIKLEKAVADAQLYWRLPQSQLYTALINILKAEENSVGRGLAKGHTIEDLDLSFTINGLPVDPESNDALNLLDGSAMVIATVGDTNYKLEGDQFQFGIVLKKIQIEATYTTKTFTGFTVLIKVHNENGTITPLNDAKGLSYKIFKKTAGGIDKSTAYAEGTLTYQNRTASDDKGGLCGVFTATYPQLPLLNSGETYFIQMYEYGVELKTNS